MAQSFRAASALLFLLLVFALSCGRGAEEGAALFPHLPEPLPRFEIANDSTEAALALRDGVWWIISPITDRADSALVDGLVRRLRAATVLGVADENPAPGRSYGLRPPRARVTAGGREVRVGSRDPVGEGVYVARPDEERVLLASGEMAPFVRLPLHRLRDHRLLRFPPSEVRRLEVEREGRRWTLERNERDRWFVAEAGLRGDPAAAWGVVRALNTMRIHSFSEETEFRGGPRPFRVTVRWPAGEAALELGDAVPETALRLARATDRPPLFRVPRYVLDSLVAHGEEPLDRSLFTFDPLAAARVELRGPEGGFTLERGRSGWSVSRGETFPAEPARARAWLRNLARLRATGFLPPGEGVRVVWTVDADGEVVSFAEEEVGIVARRAGETGALLLPEAAGPVLSTTLGDLLRTVEPD